MADRKLNIGVDAELITKRNKLRAKIKDCEKKLAEYKMSITKVYTKEDKLNIQMALHNRLNYKSQIVEINSEIFQQRDKFNKYKLSLEK